LCFNPIKLFGSTWVLQVFVEEQRKTKGMRAGFIVNRTQRETPKNILKAVKSKYFFSYEGIVVSARWLINYFMWQNIMLY
jgi:hypothetical protein